MKTTNANSKNIKLVIFKRLNFVYKNEKTETEIEYYTRYILSLINKLCRSPYSALEPEMTQIFFIFFIDFLNTT